ncbi:Rossmann-like and DUF2520 domain-containing protein [Flavobacterium sp. N1994]|uniref:Rossmann-like and DUF2520 domain-containing protein n=1 Tax=Flavobacterium sp. N1994 TaxID=2986827 RepID=UPI002221B415|nr:Rossmann-like and DUF2520 domain-containing protein [Flavobacterium sp. N1994]
MIRVSIIGSGNVAQHLIQAFSKTTEIELVQVYSRKPNVMATIATSAKIISDFTALLPVDLIIIAVTDSAISEVSKQIPFQNQLIAHTSGSMAMEVLDDKNRKGVFYPLQTFSKAKEVDFSGIPIFVEAQNDTDYQVLEIVAKSVSNSVNRIHSKQRKALHIAAVFVSNFTNHLYQIGYDICQENELPFDALKPLILETANKITTLTPTEAQTGPARRKDTQTINEHLAFLTDENQKEIYKLLTKSIIDNGKKL